MAWLSRLLRVRPAEEAMVALTVGLMCLTWAGLTIGQSSIDALLFARYGVDALPGLYLILGLLLFAASLVVTALLGRMPPQRLFLAMPLALAGLLLVGRLALLAGIELAYPALWLLAGLALFVQGLFLWGIAGLVTDTRQPKRLFPLFASGGILGATLGGFVTAPLAAWLQPENLLLVWAGILVTVCVLGAALLSAHARAPEVRRRERPPVLTSLVQGYRTVRASRLLRWMSAGAVLFSVLFYFLYLPFSRAAVDRLPDPEELAGFLGVFSGVATGVALLVSLFIANRVFARFGTPAILLAYAVAYVLGFAVLVVNASFLALVAIRFFQLVWMQGLANSAWEAMINVTPPERRDQARAFINGVPAQAGTALAGVILLIGEDTLQPRQLFLVGIGVAVISVFTAWRAKQWYAAAVLETLRAGRPHVFEGYDDAPFCGVGQDAAAVAVVVEGISDPDRRVRRVATEVLGRMRSPELVVMPLRQCARDVDPEVRAIALHSLARLGDPSALPDVVGHLSDPEPEVRLAALQAVAAMGGPAGPRLPLLDDPDPTVRAETAASLAAMGSPDAISRVLLPMSSAPDPELRVIAVRALGRVPNAEAFPLVAERLDDADPAVRAAAAEALAAVDSGRALQPLVAMLADHDSEVRTAASAALGRIGDTAVPPVAEGLDEPSMESGALQALAGLPLDGFVDRVRRYAERAAQRALRDNRLAARIVVAGDERRLLLRDSIDRLSQQEALNAIRAAALLSDRSSLFEAIANLESEDPAQRATALELIDSSKQAPLLRPVVAVWETSQAPAAMPEEGELRDHPDPWIREVAEFAIGSTGGEPMATTLPTLSVMERVLFLRKVSLFAGLAPEDLRHIAAIAEEETHSDGDVIAAQGEFGDEMYIIVSGAIRVIMDRREIDRSDQGEVVGEMAIIADQPRMASLVAKGDVRLLTIGRRQFAGILRERPETSLAMMRVLAHRLAERDPPAAS